MTVPGLASARQIATPVADLVPLHLLATGEVVLAASDTDLVWLVQRGTLSGSQRAAAEAFPLGFALALRGTIEIVDATGVSIAELAPGRAVVLPPHGGGAFTSATGDVALYVQIGLVPVSTLPGALPPESAATAAFSTRGAEEVAIELVRGFLNPGRAARLPDAAIPALLLAVDNRLQFVRDGGELVVVARDETALLAGAGTIRNDGQQPASFVVARVLPRPAALRAAATPPASTPVLQPLDPVVDEAWRRNGCHLNPGNAACTTVAVAAACAIDAATPECLSDGDGDGCADVAEVRAAFDPFDPSDCIGGGQGLPAVNCLFLSEDIACDGRRDAADVEDSCVAVREIRLRRNPTSLHGCDGATPPADACVVAARDPLCDGFGRG